MNSSTQDTSPAAKLIKWLIVGIVIYLIAPFVVYFIRMIQDVRECARERGYLLHKADYALVLAESRKLIHDFPGESIYIGDARLHPIFEEIGTQEVMI